MNAVTQNSSAPGPAAKVADWPALQQFTTLAASRLAAGPRDRGMSVTLLGESAAIRSATLERIEARLRDNHGCNTLRVRPWRYDDADDYWARIGAALCDGLTGDGRDRDQCLRLRGIALDERGSPRGRLALDRLLQVLLQARGESAPPLVVLFDDRHVAPPAVEAAVVASTQSLFRRPGVVSVLLAGEPAGAASDLVLHLPVVPRTAFTDYLEQCLAQAGLLDGRAGLDRGWVPVLRRAFYPRLSEARRFIAHLRFEVERFHAATRAKTEQHAHRNDLQRLAFLTCLDWCHRAFVAGLRRGGLEPDDVLSHQARFLAEWPDDELSVYEPTDENGVDDDAQGERALRALFVQCFRSGAVIEGRPLVPPFSGPLHVAALLYFRAASEPATTSGAAALAADGRWWHGLLGHRDQARPESAAGAAAPAREELRQLREDAAWAGVVSSDEAQALRADPDRLRRALESAMARCTDERAREDLTLRLVRLDISEGKFEAATTRASELEQQMSAEEPYRLFAVRALQITAHDLADQWGPARARLDESQRLAEQTGLGHVRRDLLLRAARLQFHSPVGAENNHALRTLESALKVAREVDTPPDQLREFDAWQATIDRTAGAPPCLFVSYAHADRDWRDWICARLEALSDGGRRFTTWYDHRDIAAGRSWLEQILSALDRSRYSLLLVSDAFLESSFVARFELPRIRNRLLRRPHLGHVSLALHLRPTSSELAADAPGWLDELQGLNDPQGELLDNGARVGFVDLDEAAREAAWAGIAARLEAVMGLPDKPHGDPGEDDDGDSSRVEDPSPTES